MPTVKKNTSEIELGIDLGSSSVGWAIIDTKNTQLSICGVGARVFDAGLDNLQADGKGESRNVERRGARQVRRRLERISRRLVLLAGRLQGAGLLPPGNIKGAEQRDIFFRNLDAELASPYQLRGRGLDKKLEPFEIGRVFYHMGQRRGFLSNRKSAPKAEKEEKGIKKEISDLEKEICEKGFRTLGELFASYEKEGVKIRSRYTSRKLYEEEFELVWSAQAGHYSEILTKELKKKIKNAIFYQRPLKSQKKFVGWCEYERDRRRAPWAILDAQRFRYLQKVNDLEIIDESTGEVRRLTGGERKSLISALEISGEKTFGGIRRLLKLHNKVKFNLETAGEEKIKGNRTAAGLVKILGEEMWNSFTDSERDAIVEDIMTIVRDESLKKRGQQRWGLGEEAAEKFSHMTVDSGYCAFSRQALKKILNGEKSGGLEEGLRLNEVLREEYPERWERKGEPKALLPQVDSDEMPDLRNPIVHRSLTELRRVVNAIVKRYGKPDTIRIELANDLRKSSKQRESSWKNMRANEKARARAAEEIIKETDIKEPSREDILKYLLAEESNWRCPYTGKQISMSTLFGSHPQFDIEHIIPHDRCLDDSYMNKTLCYAEENRNRKHNRTPYETYSETEKWDDIIGRVKEFHGNAKYIKLKRFKMSPAEIDKEILANFDSRQLNDTRYAAKLAKQYLGLLYGGIDQDGIDGTGKRRVMTSKGQLTAKLRWLWGLNSVLGDGEFKSRDDHRHHALDAIVVALTDPSKVKMLSEAARRSTNPERLFERIPFPWENFRNDVQSAVNQIVTSHRVSNRVRGPLHAQTFYGNPHVGEDGKNYVVSRVPVEILSEKKTGKNLESIIDPVVKNAVKSKLAEMKKEPKEAFKDPNNHPILVVGDGRQIPIHRVKIRYPETTYPIGEGHRRRYVATEENHHMEVYEVSKNGKTKWDAKVVSLLEAYQRKKDGLPIINQSFGEGAKFLFSLSKGDMIELDDPDRGRGLFVVRIIPQSKQIYFVPINDARPLKDVGKTRLTAYPESLKERNCQKMFITPLGEVRRCNN